MKKILILDCDFDLGKDSTTRAIINILKDKNVSRYRVCENNFPEELDYSHVIITGSNASIFDDYKWITKLKKLILKIYENKIPSLGICFGHQLMTDVFGGKVEKKNKAEIGLKKIKPIKKDPLFKEINNFIFFQFHKYSVKNMPENAELLAKNDFGMQTVKFGNNIYGVQFHPEVGIKLAKKILEKRNKKLVKKKNEDYDQERRKLFLNFINMN